MKIVHISDTHCYHRRIKLIPDGDVLIHSGDITGRGEIGVLDDFATWMSELPHKHKLIIAGNHDGTLQENTIQKQEILKMFEECYIIYLEDSGIEIDGKYFYGAPWQPEFHNWSFNLQRGKEIAKKWRLIPDRTNILITHGPPMNILDKAPRGVFGYEHTGCQDLFERILELRYLKLHLFGHIHEDYGMFEDFGIKFVNSSICTGSYQPTNLPQVIEVE